MGKQTTWSRAINKLDDIRLDAGVNNAELREFHDLKDNLMAFLIEREVAHR